MVLVYFYPKDATLGYTKEACMIRDFWADFEKKDAVVFGVSTDSVKVTKNLLKNNNCRSHFFLMKKKTL